MLRTLIYFSFAFSLLLSCTSDKPTKSDDLVLTTRLKNSPRGLHPILYQTATENLVNNLLFKGLADYNPKTLRFESIFLEELPEMKRIEEGPYEGKPSYTIKIKNDVMWDDDRKVTAEDYLFSLKCLKHPEVNSPRMRAYYSPVIDCILNPKDPQECTVILEKNSIADMELITSVKILDRKIYDRNNWMNLASLMDLNEENYKNLGVEKEAYDKFAEAFNSAVYSRDSIGGLGAYQLKEWVSDQYISLIRKEKVNQKYQNSPLHMAGPKEIVFLLTPDESTAFSQFLSGQYDIYPGLSYQQEEEINNNASLSEDFTVHQVSIPRYYYMPLNTRTPALEESAVRNALAHLVNVDTIIAGYEKGAGERINSPFLSVDDQSTLKDVSFDIEQAKKILSEAGWEDSNGNGSRDKMKDGKLVELNIDIISTGSNLGKLISGLLKQEAMKAGVIINVQNVTQELYKNKLANLDFDITIGVKGQSLAPYDPYPLLHTDNTDPGEPNMSNFGNEESDRLIELIRSTTDPKERDQAYLDLERILYQEKSLIFLYSPSQRIAVNNNLEGIISSKNPGFHLNTFKKAE